jgi:membrane fusion protein (multidrug efflux system)
LYRSLTDRKGEDELNDEGTRLAAVSRSSRRRTVAILILLIAAAGVLGYRVIGRGQVSTDDAQIQGDLVAISPRVSGYVHRIFVDDNQDAGKGQILVQLDRRDLEARLRSSEANLALATAQAAAASTQVSLVQRTSTAGEQQAGATVSAADAGVAASQSQIASAQAQAASAHANADAAGDGVTSARSDVATAEAQIDAARAALQAALADVSSAEAQAKKVASDAARYRQLYEHGAASKQQLEAAEAANVSAEAALDAARERVSSANAALAQSRARKAAAEAGLKQAMSRTTSAQAAAAQAMAAVKTARTALSEARARLAGARAGQSGAQTSPQQISISKAQDKAAAARIRQAMADVRNARLQLSYTEIVAPTVGVVSQKTAQPGQFVQPGQLLMALVPLQNVWVVANFKETQIGRMRHDQLARITVDAYPGLTLRGRVESIGAGTGAKFSLLPAENATGNFVKVVQRIPVKIVFDEPIPKGVVLRPGMNVAATVDVRGGRG